MAKALQLKVIINSLDAANADLDTSMASIDSSIPALDTTDDEIDSANAHLDHAKQTLEEAGESLKMKLIKLLNAKEHLEHANASLDTAKDNLALNTISVIGDNLDFAKSHIDFAKYELNYDIMPFLELLFTRLEVRVEEGSTVSDESKPLLKQSFSSTYLVMNIN
jgi:DNA repair exonuclease SbcCD ATPase subunit